MRNEKHERVTDYRNNVKREKRAAVSPKIDYHAAGIGVNRTEQCAERVVETDYKNARAERLKKLRYEPHPEFFASADHKDREQENDEVAFQSEETRDSRKPDIPALCFLVRCWRIRLRVHVSVVLVRGRGRNSLRCASNFHTSC